MKLKKTKLTAVVMSALMAASTMSPLVYAEEESIIVEDAGAVESVEPVAEVPVAETLTVEEVVEEEQADNTIELANTVDGAYELVKDSVKFLWPTDKSYKVEYTVKHVVDGNATYDVKYAEAYEFSKTAADCENDGVLVLEVEIMGEKFRSSDKFVVEKALGHDDTEVRRQTLENPTHFEEGLAHVWVKCNRCGREDDHDVVLPVQEHTWADEYSYDNFVNILLDDDGNFVPDENGLPQLDDWTMDGSYDKFIACTKDDEEKPDSRETVELLAKKGVYAVITDQGGIADDLIGYETHEPSVDLPLPNDDIELLDCTKDGWYIVSYFTQDDKRLSDEKIIVTKHHMLTPVTVEFNSQDDMDQCVVEYNADGESYTITNKSCYLPITYDEVIHCTAAGCPNEICKNEFAVANPVLGHDALHFVSEKEVVADPAGDHVIDADTKREIAQAVADGVTYEELQEIVKGKKFVKLSNDTSTCTEDGTATVEYDCMVCYPHVGTVVLTEQVEVLAKGHIVEAPTRENYVAPTCTEMGSYDAVTYCGRCGEVIREKRHIMIPRIKHTNELFVEPNGVGEEDHDDTLLAKHVVFDCSDPSAIIVAPLYGEYAVGDVMDDYIGFGDAYPSLGASFVPYSTCDVCGHEVEIYDVATIEVKDVKKETRTGKAGSITVEVTYTNSEDETTGREEYTFEYFSTLAAYQSRVEETPLNGLNLDSDGTFRYYKDGVFQKDFAGIVKYQGGEFFVSNGELCSEANGLNSFGDDWYFLAEGKIVRGYNGLAEYNGAWFYIVNGKLQDTVTGLVPYNGGYFVFANGQLQDKANGLWQDFDGTWYFLSKGQVQSWFNGVAMFEGGFFVVKNGVLDSNYNGTIEYDGATFNVVAGQLYDQVA